MSPVQTLRVEPPLGGRDLLDTLVRSLSDLFDAAFPAPFEGAEEITLGVHIEPSISRCYFIVMPPVGSLSEEQQAHLRALLWSDYCPIDLSLRSTVNWLLFETGSSSLRKER